MAKDSVSEAFEEVTKEFNEFRKEFGAILNAVSQLDQAKAGDDVEALLEKLEEAVGMVRTGGVLGSGVNDYSRARENWQEAVASAG
jgi:phage-related tail protein